MSNDNLKWYHGKITREVAEQILQNEGSGDGTFLVRESNTAAGDFVLSVLFERSVVHYQIRKHGGDAYFSIDEKTIIHGLDTLIEYYQEDAHGLVTCLKFICEQDPPPHDSRRHGRTNLLHRATKEGNYTVVSELLKHGYHSLEAKNQEGQTAVHLASRMGKDDILKKLIESGATIDCRDTAGFTPLHYACQSNLPNTVHLLVLRGGANVQARNPDTGWVAMHEAAARGHCETVRMLLALDAPVRPRTAKNQTPEDLAVQNDHSECARLLREYKKPAAKTKREKWYHGTLDRSEATALLNGKPDGSFLIRYSDKNSGAYVLTMIYEGITFNYIIRTRDELLFIDNGPYLESLEHIVDFYSCMSDGLPTTLQVPVPPQPKPPLPEFSTMPRPSKRTVDRRILCSQFSTSRALEKNHRDPLPNLSLLSNIDAEFIHANIIFSTPPPPPPPPLKPCVTPIERPTINDNYETSNDEVISRYYVELETVIGEGEFGNVYRAIYSPPGQIPTKVAVKTLHAEHADRDRDSFLSEAKVMMRLQHHCIVKLIGISHGPPLMMIQEYVEFGSLLQYLLKYPKTVSPDYELKIWASQIACGMKYLEEQRFVHRDLAARNILLASKHQAKISDFGLSRALSMDREYYQASHGGKWPLRWYAPESYNYGTFSHSSDVWSFGVLLWEMFSFGQQPYGDRKGVDVICGIDKGERLSQPELCPDHIYEIMLKCWEREPKDRPTFTYLLDIFSSDPEYINIKQLIADTNIT